MAKKCPRCGRDFSSHMKQCQSCGTLYCPKCAGEPPTKIGTTNYWYAGGYDCPNCKGKAKDVSF